MGPHDDTDDYRIDDRYDGTPLDELQRIEDDDALDDPPPGIGPEPIWFD